MGVEKNCRKSVGHFEVHRKYSMGRFEVERRKSLANLEMHRRKSSGLFNRRKSQIKRPRLVDKSGNLNVIQTGISRRAKSYVMDIFLTIVDTKWRYIFLIFTFGFLLSWVVFACFYYCFSHLNGDFDTLPANNQTTVPVPCVENGVDFITILLFSFETQTTIGYGSRYVRDVCIASIIGVMLQSICGAVLQAFLTGIILTKVQKPKRRAQTILFSKIACISSEGSDQYFSIRVGDIQKSHIIDVSVRAICVMDKLVDVSGKKSKFCYEFEFIRMNKNEKIHIYWPVTIYHRITPQSPLWQIKETTLQAADLEVIVVLEGTSESTGTAVQARRSYTGEDIFWGQRFKPLKLLNKESCTRHDYSGFHETVSVCDTTNEIPECSDNDVHCD